MTIFQCHFFSMEIKLIVTCSKSMLTNVKSHRIVKAPNFGCGQEYLAITERLWNSDNNRTPSCVDHKNHDYSTEIIKQQ